MKNRWTLAVLAMLLLASCTNDNTVDPQEDASTLIGLGVTNMAVTTNSRGLGTVGGMNYATNVFRGERIYLLMTTVGQTPWGYTTSANAEGTTNIFGPGSWATPMRSEDASGWYLNYHEWSQQAKKYYPIHGRSDFFGFYVDDAGDPDMTKNYRMRGDSVTIPVAINGTQDLLAGKAVNVATGASIGFSAKTARTENKRPSIYMKHLLTRLTFSVKNDAEPVVVAGKTYDMRLEYVKIVNTPFLADMTVAYNEQTEGKNPLELLEWDENHMGEFWLCDSVSGWYQGGKNKKLETLKPVAVPVNADSETGAYLNPEVGPQKVGEAMFVQPNQDKHKMELKLTFPKKGEGETVVWETRVVRLDIICSSGKMEIGKSYNVNIITHGLQEIEVDVMIQPWTDGGSQDIDVTGNITPTN